MTLTNLGAKFLALLLACFAIGKVHAQKTEPLFFDHNAEIISAQYDEDDNLLVTASDNGIVNLWDPETGRLIRSFGTVTKIPNSFFADFSPDGKLIAAVYGRGGKVWNTKFGDLVCTLSGYSDTIKSIHFSDNNKWLITASLDGTAKLWDVQTGKRHHSLNHMLESLGKKEQQSAVTDARFCEKDKSIVTGSGKVIWNSKHVELDSGLTVDTRRDSSRYDSVALVWDMKTGKVIHTLAGYPFDVSPDGARIVSGSVNISGQDAKVWDIVTGKVIHSLSGHTGKVTACQFSRNGKWILTVSNDDGMCQLWDAVSGKFICYLKAGPGNRSCTAQFSPDGKWISTFSQDTTNIWNIPSGKLLHAVPAEHPITFSNDSQHFVVLNGNRAAVYDVVSGKPVLVEKKPAGMGNKKVLKIR